MRKHSSFVAWELHFKTHLHKSLYSAIHKIIGGMLISSMVFMQEPSCALAAISQKDQSKYGGTFRLGWYQRPLPFNPFTTQDTITVPLMEIVFNRLVRFDSSGKFEPDLAERWEISEGGLKYKFFLKKGVFFQDGQECTAQDVLASLELRKREDSSVERPLLKNVKKWDMLSRYEIEIELFEPASSFFLILSGIKIAPQRLLDSASTEAFEKRPVGTGPFRFVKQNASGDLTLEAYENYFEGRPFLDKIEVKIYPDKEKVWAAFLRGEIDAFFNAESRHLSEVKKMEEISTYHAVYMACYALIFNFRNPLMQNQNIRNAISLSVNRSELLSVLEEGRGVALDGPVMPDSWGYSRSQSGLEFNPDIARKIFEENGIIDSNVQSMQGNKTLSLKILVDSKNQHLVDLIKLLKQQLEEIGLAVFPEYFSTNEEFLEKTHQRKDIHAYLLLINVAGPEPGVLSRYWHTGESNNVGEFSSAEADELFDKVQRLPQENLRAEAYRKVQEILSREKPAIFLYSPYVFYLVASRFQNVDPMFHPFLLPYKLKDVFELKK